uniref:ATP synthase F0 subunit 8 n=1 Tax=Longitarsus aeneus TaxID=1425580 RepID=A0A3G1GND0_9CUCU|nr:ATP synthase F0 subunit 8 [Longitarsus aeneus]
MPQMMPLNWLTLMMFFTFSYFLFNNMIFWNFLYNPKSSMIKKEKLSLNWKW